jgi:hypothetical protein
MTLIGLFLFLLISLIVIIAGALQCFAPRMFREIQKRFRVKANWSAGAVGNSSRTWLNEMRRIHQCLIALAD